MLTHPLVRDFLSRGSQYLLIIAGSLFIFLVLAPLAGFIPYSSNPGWHSGFFELTKQDFWENTYFMARWLRIFMIYAIAVFVVLFAIIRVMEYFKGDAETIAYTSGILSAFLSGYVVHVAGWHIMIDTSGVILVFVVGFFYGVKLLPVQPMTFEMIRKKE